MKRYYLIFILFLNVGFVGAVDTLTFGTNNIRSLYFPLGGALCQIFSSDGGPQCQVAITDGGAQNIEGLHNGVYDIAVVPENLVYMSFLAQGKNPFTYNLRALFSLGDMALMFIVPEHSPIKSFHDLKGKQIGVLKGETPVSETLQEFKAFIGWEPKHMNILPYDSTREEVIDFCNGKVDALVLMDGNPNPLGNLLMRGCAFRMLDIPQDIIKKFTDTKSYLHPTTVPANVYGNHDPVLTIGTKALVVVSNDIDPSLVKRLLKRLKKNFHYLQAQHIYLKGATFQNMINQIISVPRHVGVLEVSKGL